MRNPTDHGQWEDEADEVDRNLAALRAKFFEILNDEMSCAIMAGNLEGVDTLKMLKERLENEL